MEASVGRSLSFFICAIATIPAARCTAQLSAGFAVARAFSTGTAEWQPAARFGGDLRFDRPNASLLLSGTMDRVDGQTRFGSLAISPVVTTPTLAGFRIVNSVDYARTVAVPSVPASLRATSSVAYRYASGGGWIGYPAARLSTPSIVSGLWSQLGSRATAAVTTRIRRGIIGGLPARYWTVPIFDSVFTDTGGWEE